MRNIGFSFFLLIVVCITSAYTLGVPEQKGAKLRPELRLKTYDRAISLYEKGRAFFQEGKYREAIRELKHALWTAADFPEAQALLIEAYEAVGQKEKAEKARQAIPEVGREGSLLQRRAALMREVEWLESQDQSLRVPKNWGLGVSLFLILLFLGTMGFDSWRMRRQFAPGKTSIIVEPFVSDDYETELTGLFKVCLFLLPFPLFFALLLVLGIDKVREVISITLFAGGTADAAIWAIFFSNLWDLFRP